MTSGVRLFSVFHRRLTLRRLCLRWRGSSSTRVNGNPEEKSTKQGLVCRQFMWEVIMDCGSKRLGSWDRKRGKPRQDELWGSLLWLREPDTPSGGPGTGAVSNRLEITPGGISSPALLGCVPITPSGIRPSGLLRCWRSSGQKAKRCVACSWNDRLTMRWVWAHVWSSAVAIAEMKGGLKDVTLPPEGLAIHYKWDFPPKSL